MESFVLYNLSNMSTVRTPPSLNWLIDKRARLLGDLLGLEKSLCMQIGRLDEEIQNARRALEIALEQRIVQPKHLQASIEDTKARLQAIDIALKMHDIQIDPDIILPIRTYKPRVNCRHGELTRLIIEKLHHAAGRPLPVNEISAYIASIWGIEVDTRLNTSVANRLKNMYAAGRVNRVYKAHWILPGYSSESQA